MKGTRIFRFSVFFSDKGGLVTCRRIGATKYREWETQYSVTLLYYTYFE